MIKIKSYLLVLIQFVCIAYILATGSVLPHSLIFVVLFVLALALGLWALWIINFRHFRLTPDFPKDARIVAKGPYKLIRHPMYLCVLILTLMLVLDDFSYQRMGVWILLFADLYIKLLYEEKLIAHRNSDYLIYKRSTNRLIPYIH